MNVPASRTLDPPLEVKEAERLLYREARLLDEQRYEEWRQLYAEDPLYWMVDQNQQDAEEDEWMNMVSQMHRNGESLDYFIDRATSEQAWVYQRARVDRFYTNVMVDDPERGRVYCKWIMQLIRVDRDTFDWFGGKSLYTLVRQDEGNLRIKMKKVINSHHMVPRGYQPIV